MKHNIYKSAAQVTVFSTVEKALSFFYRIVLSRLIGAQGIGIYQICLSVFAVFLTFSSSGIPVTVSRLMSKENALGNERGKYASVTAGVVCTLCLTIPLVAIAFLCKDAFSFAFGDERISGLFLILMPSLIINSVYAVMRGAFWGNKQFIAYSLIELVEDAVMVACGCLLISGTNDAFDGAKGAIWAVVISYVFSFVASLVYYFAKGGKFAPFKDRLKPLISSATPVTAMRTYSSLLGSAIAVFLPFMLTTFAGVDADDAVSLYGIAVGMSLPVLYIPNSLIGSIAVVVAPEMSENYYRNDVKKLKTDVEKTVKTSVLIAIFLTPLLFCLGDEIGVFLYADKLSGALIKTYSFMLLPACISMMTTTILNSLGCETKTLVYSLFGALVLVGCIVVLTPILSIHSYMIGTSLSYVLTALLNSRLLAKKCPSAHVEKYVFGCVISGVCACLFGWFLDGILASFLPLFWQITIEGICIFSFVIGCAYSFNLLSIKPIKKLLLKNY